MMGRAVERDERTIAVEGNANRWAYRVLSFGLLMIIGVRSFANHQSSWDLFALLFLGAAVNAAYQGMHRVLYKRWAVMVAVTMLLAALVAVAIAAMRR